MGSMTMGSGLDLLPWGARLIWITLFGWVAASHTTHILFMRGQPRAWHCTHLLMAVGMLYMITPWRGSVAYRGWSYAFVGAAAAILLFVVAQWIRGHAVNLLWFVQLVAMGSMAFMFALMTGLDGAAVRWITYGLIGYYVLEAAGWSRREFAEADERRLSWLPFSVHPRRGGAVCASGLCGRVPVDLAFSGAVMALGMAYMFLDMDGRARSFLHEATSVGHGGASTALILAILAIVVLVAPLRGTPGGLANVE